MNHATAGRFSVLLFYSARLGTWLDKKKAYDMKGATSCSRMPSAPFPTAEEVLPMLWDNLLPMSRHLIAVRPVRADKPTVSIRSDIEGGKGIRSSGTSYAAHPKEEFLLNYFPFKCMINKRIVFLAERKM
jgi:hypothetical protein